MSSQDLQTRIGTQRASCAVFVDDYDAVNDDGGTSRHVFLSIQLSGGSMHCVLDRAQAQQLAAAVQRILEADVKEAV